MKAHVLAHLLLCVGIAGCAMSHVTNVVPMNGTFTLAPGESASVGGEYVVRFDSVTNDSRCPEGVECVWAGNATVALTVDWSSPHHITLNTLPENAKSVMVGSLLIALDSLAPRSRPTDAQTYIVTLRTSGADDR